MTMALRTSAKVLSSITSRLGSQSVVRSFTSAPATEDDETTVTQTEEATTEPQAVEQVEEKVEASEEQQETEVTGEAAEVVESEPYDYIANQPIYNEYSYYDIDTVCVPHRIEQPSADFKDACTLPSIQ